MGVGVGVGRAGVGVEVGDAVARGVGALDGVCVGTSVGAIVGVAVGAIVGVTVGAIVGVTVGAIVGVTVGAAEGNSVGTGDGDCECIEVDLSKVSGIGSTVVSVCARDTPFDSSRWRAWSSTRRCALAALHMTCTSSPYPSAKRSARCAQPRGRWRCFLVVSSIPSAVSPCPTTDITHDSVSAHHSQRVW